VSTTLIFGTSAQSCSAGIKRTL